MFISVLTDMYIFFVLDNEHLLTLIRAAGGEYDLRNFEEV
jgi:hypothetical protein